MVVLGAILLTACGGVQRQASQSWMQPNGKVKVLSTTCMVDDLVGQIGGDRVDHLALITGECDPHRYELLKGDDEKFIVADIVFHNGLGLEHGASLHQRLELHPRQIAVGEEIRRQVPHQIRYPEGQPDPHVWMDIALWVRAVDPIAEALAAFDPASASFYFENASRLKSEMQALHEEILARFAQIPSEKRFLVSSHDAFHYFTRSYLADPEEKTSSAWEQRFAAPEGLAPEGQLSHTDIQWIVRFVEEHHVPVVFHESNVSRDALRKIVWVLGEKGHTAHLSERPLYGDAMGPPGSDGDSYLKMMRHNADTIFEEWTR